MAVGVPFKIMSNGTSGTVDKIGLWIVKVSLPSVNKGPWQLAEKFFGITLRLGYQALNYIF
jgi:hypothetical protein